MAFAGPSNILARRVTDDLIDFSESMGDADDVFDTLMCLKDDIRDENTKLMGLNEAIAPAEDKIATKEGHVKIIEADIEDDRSITETDSMNNDSRVDVSSLGGLV
ncbi:hypothetical protein Tco_0452947 [Tanacetum coccineum]